MNSRKIFIFVLIALFVAGGAFLFSSKKEITHSAGQSVYYCPMHPTYTSDRPGTCPICNMNLVKKEDSVTMNPREQVAQQLKDICIIHNCAKTHDGKSCSMLVVGKEGEIIDCPVCGKHIIEGDKVKKILYWTDPMIPGYKSDKPGKSPMGMDLVPVYEEDAAAPSGTSPSPSGYTPILLTPQKQQLIGVKTAPAEIRPLKKTIRTVGTVAHDPELYQAQAEYIQAIQALERAKGSNIPDVTEQAARLVESTKIRLRHSGLSEELISEIASWKEPEHGLLFSHPGEPVWVYAKIYEYELPLVKVGQKIDVDVPALADETFTGVIRAIDPMVDPATRTTRIRAQVQDSKGNLKPEMFVNVTIDIDLGEVLAIPEESLLDTGEKKIVFVDKGQGIFEPRDVAVGSKADGYYEVKSGLTKGETVVTSGNFLIDSESRLKAAIEGTGSPGEHQHGN